MFANSDGILVLFAHPALQKSRVNRRLCEEPKRLEGVTFHDLYEAYPRFDIDVAREQELLASHHAIVFQHPFYWYSTPSILKEWQDLVLEHGWAYGTGGDALRGKIAINAVSTGGREDAYSHEGYNRHTMLELLAPMKQTAALCGMRYLPPFVTHGSHTVEADHIDAQAREYRRFLEALRDGNIDVDRACTLPRINADLSAVIRVEAGS